VKKYYCFEKKYCNKWKIQIKINGQNKLVVSLLYPILKWFKSAVLNLGYAYP
jgi:hypothetical protein